MELLQSKLTNLNKHFKGIVPEEIISWALNNCKMAIATTSFGPYSAAMLHAVTEVKKNIPVIWCDTGYNTKETYLHADRLITGLNLNIKLYSPRKTTAYLEAIMGTPDINNPRHSEFTEQLKLEPFRRAMQEHGPDLWFANLRKGQTAFRDNLDILTMDESGMLKVCPFYHWNDSDLDEYLQRYNLPNEFNYYDPIKFLKNRECGIHIPEE